MSSFLKSLVLLCLVQFSLVAQEIKTFYGDIEVEEPVLIELIESPAFQRLRDIRQYGVSYYTSFRENYTRYDHSLGVFTILRLKGASLEEQIAGLLHDVSHTVFSHVGDWIFHKEGQDEDYQNSIHENYLEKSGLGAILNKYGYTCEQVLPHGELFPVLEQPSPDLCADRIDYNIQGAYHQGFITHEEAVEIFKDLRFVDNRWESTRPDLMKKVVRFSIFMTENCWGSAMNHLSSRWLADAILRSVEIGEITLDEIHFSTDQVVWNKLISSTDPVVQKKIDMVLNTKQLYALTDHTEADFVVRSKFRGIDPWMNHNNQKLRLTSIDPELAKEYQASKEKMHQGWAIKLISAQ